MSAPTVNRNNTRARLARVRDLGPGAACSLLLHILFGILGFYLLVKLPAAPPNPLLRYLPIDLVQPAQPTTSPVAREAGTPRAAISRAARELPSSLRPPVALSRRRARPPPDVLEIRLRALAKLRQPDSVLAHLDNGASDLTENSDTARPGADAGYRVRDFIRAQVERRWSLDLVRAHNAVILIHVVVRRDGHVEQAEIVDRAHLANDAAWRALALSARNAVLLSSPMVFPAGVAPARLDLVLALNPKDVLR